MARNTRSDQISESIFVLPNEEKIEYPLEVSKGSEFESQDMGVNLKPVTISTGNEATVSPVGRLKERAGKWADFGASAEILDIVENGYKLPLHTLPDSKELRNNRSARDHSDFVLEEIDKLLEKGCVSEVHTKSIVVNPLTVSENKGKCRLVLDCRHINPHLYKNKFKYEDASVAKDIF